MYVSFEFTAPGRLYILRLVTSGVGQLKQSSDWSYKPVSIIDPPTLPNRYVGKKMFCALKKIF